MTTEQTARVSAHSKDDIPTAISVRLKVCACPHVRFELRDAEGKVFAQAIVDPAQFAHMVASVTAAIGALPAPDQIGACVGHG